MVPHIYGLPVEMSKIIRIAKKHNLKIIEDSAEVLGLTYNKKKSVVLLEMSRFLVFMLINT